MLINKYVSRIGLLTILLLIMSAVGIYSCWPRLLLDFSSAAQSIPRYPINVYKSYLFNVLKHPTGLAIFPSFFESGTRYLFIADSGNNVIRVFITRSSGSPSLQTIAGSGSPGYSDGNLLTAA